MCKRSLRKQGWWLLPQATVPSRIFTGHIPRTSDAKLYGRFAWRNCSGNSVVCGSIHSLPEFSADFSKSNLRSFQYKADCPSSICSTGPSSYKLNVRNCNRPSGIGYSSSGHVCSYCSTGEYI